MTRRALTAGLAFLALSGCGGGDDEVPRTRDPRVTALQVELMKRASRDQAIRDTVFARGLEMDPGALARMQRLDSMNTTWLKEEIRAHGWPSAAKVGKAAGDAAFLIVQHATHDPAFQRMMLDTILIAFDRKEVDGQSYALLYDRVQSQAGRKQRYGTQAQLKGKRVVFEPMEDSARVDSFRKTVGLPPLEAYRRTLDSVYLGKKPRTAKPG